MMMNFEKSVKTCFAVGMVLISTCAAAATTQFTKGKSWLSKNTYYPTQTQNAAQANSSGRTKLMAVSNSNANDGCRVFDITISMYRERTPEERAAICDIITNFAAVVYEATDGKHKIGKVWVLCKESSCFCDVIWKKQGRSCASLCINTKRDDGIRIPLSGQIQLFDTWVGENGALLRDLLGNPKSGGAVFAHEWSHAQYGLGDEYEESNDSYYWQMNGIDTSNGNYYKPHGLDSPVALSLMNTTPHDFGQVVAALNFSISPNAQVGAEYEGHKSTGCHYVWINSEKYFIGATAQYRLYGKSAWEQLKDPSESKVHSTTPVFEEFSQHDVNAIPSYELTREDGVRTALSDLEIIWAQDRPVMVYLCIDLSGSMTVPNVENVKDTAISLVNGVPIGTVVGVATFSDSSSFQRYVKLTVITDENRKAIVQAIGQINSGNGNTAIWDAAMSALEDIRTFSPNDIRPREKLMLSASGFDSLENTARNHGAASIILLTDGQDNDSESDSHDVVAKCKELGVSFNAIGYGAGADNESLKGASKATGGHHHSSSQEGNSLPEAFFRQFTSSSFRVALADYSCTSVAQQTFSHSFFVDSTLTNVIMNVVLSRATADDVVQFIAPDGTVCSGERTETSTGVTYAYRAASCAVGEWTVTASVGKDVETTIYADADSVGDDMRVNGAISDDETPKLVVSIGAMHSITGAQVTACIPCDGFVREVPFEENGYGCYSLDLVRCGAEAAKNGLTVRCDIRKGEAYVNYDDGLVSPALDEGSESVKESKTRVIHFTADELKDAVGSIQASGSAEVNNVKVSSRWPFDSKLDIDFTVACASEQPVFISVVGHDYDLNRELRATWWIAEVNAPDLV